VRNYSIQKTYGHSSLNWHSEARGLAKAAEYCLAELRRNNAQEYY